jgi:GT2 family glycosyltransferase
MRDLVPETGGYPRVACIVLNWNGWQDTIECLDSLQACTYPNVFVIVVDNDSKDGSVGQIRGAYPNVKLLQSGSNRGFAGGNNIGIRQALTQEADYVWLLNNDTKASPDALTALVTKALTDRRIGAVASICNYADAPSMVESWAGARMNLWIGYARNSTEPHEDGWFHSLYGASMLVTREAIEEVGLLDEGFFLYWEETELCLRLRRAGWKLAAAPESRILHKVHGSTGGNKHTFDRHNTASGLRILRLHSPAPHLAMCLFLLIRFARRILRFQFSRCRSVCAGVRDYRQMIPITPRIR